MSEENTEQTTEETSKDQGLKLQGLFAFKKGMSSVYTENGDIVPVTVLEYEPWVVTQLKTDASDGYQAVQIACRPKTAKNGNAAESKRLKAAGFENGAKLVKEVRQDLPENVKVGDRVQLSSLAPGDKVQIMGVSKGRGFQGVIKRHGFGGGPAAHGSKFHRRPGSIGNRTWPGRVMPGRKLPGQYGNKRATVKNVEVVSVLEDENVVLVKGPVPGARNSLVKLMKV